MQIFKVENPASCMIELGDREVGYREDGIGLPDV